MYCLTVTDRGGGRWSVGKSRRHSSLQVVLTRDGRWQADRPDNPRFRFSYDEAIAAARRHAATMTLGGHVAADVIASHLAGSCPDRDQRGGAR